MTGYRFKPSVTAWLLLGVVLPAFITLGFWQLHRAEEKAALNALQEARSQDIAVRLAPEIPEALEPLRFRRVWAEGEYDTARQFLLDNQLQGQAPGYHVLTPLRLAGSGKAILVNRGWVPLGPSRASLPDIALAPAGPARVQGTLDRLHRVGYRLKGAEIPGAGWPSVVQLPEPASLAVRLGYPLLPYQVLLAPDAANGYSRLWHAAKLDPGKHRGYALQWFLFAACAVFFFVRHGLRNAAHPHDKL